VSAKDLKVAAATGAAAAANAAAASSALAQIGFEYGVDGLRDDLPGVCVLFQFLCG
jgi:hypothetical protein